LFCSIDTAAWFDLTPLLNRIGHLVTRFFFLEYAKDLKVLSVKRTFTEQKVFLRSFIKRIDFTPDDIAINYTIFMPAAWTHWY